MPRQFTVVIERDSDGWLIASVPQLRGCHTQARSMDELMKRIREAVQLCLEVKGDNDGEVELIDIQQLQVDA